MEKFHFGEEQSSGWQRGTGFSDLENVAQDGPLVADVDSQRSAVALLRDDQGPAWRPASPRREGLHGAPDMVKNACMAPQA